MAVETRKASKRFTNDRTEFYLIACSGPFALRRRGYNDEPQLTNAPAKKSMLIRNATHFVRFEKPRFEFFNEIHNFLREAP
jgi:hypothetical protein